MVPVLWLLALFGVSFSQVIDYRNCPDVEIVSDFNLTAYLGTWYQHSRYWEYFEKGTRCSNSTYSMKPNGSIDVLDENVYIATNKHQKMHGVANPSGNGTEGKLTFSYPPTKGDFNDINNKFIPTRPKIVPITVPKFNLQSDNNIQNSAIDCCTVNAEYVILDTDYESWATVWYCLGRDTVGSVRYAWLYTREINPSDEVINATVTVLEKYGIPTDILISVSQENCNIV